MSEEYKPRKFDVEKGGIFVSHPPKDYGIAICHKCKLWIESKDWENPKVLCEDCFKEEKEDEVK